MPRGSVGAEWSRLPGATESPRRGSASDSAASAAASPPSASPASAAAAAPPTISLQIGPHQFRDTVSGTVLEYTVSGSPVESSKGIVLYLTATTGVVPFERANGRKTRKRPRSWRAWSHLDGFTLVVLKSGVHVESSKRTWRNKPFEGGDLFAHHIRRIFTNAFFVLIGASRGAWWAARWAAADNRGQVWDRVICVGGYREEAGSPFHFVLLAYVPCSCLYSQMCCHHNVALRLFSFFV